MLLPALMASFGCGYQLYEERLERTKRLYDYLAVLDENLQRQAWDRRDLGMSMRVPKSFQVMTPPPPPEKDEDGNLIYPPDPRQPHVLGVELEGLVDGWTAQLPSGPALLYVFSNHGRFQGEVGMETSPPNTFLADWEYAVASAFQQTLSAEESLSADDNVRYRVLIPERSSPAAEYVTQKDFTAIRLVSNEPVGGQELQGIVYELQSGVIQVAVLCLCPKDVGPQFRDRLQMALQTLQVSSQPPQAAGTGGGRTPGGGGPIGF